MSCETKHNRGNAPFIQGTSQQTCPGVSNLWVQGSVDLIEEVEGRWVTSLDGEDERQGHYGLLPS